MLKVDKYDIPASPSSGMCSDTSSGRPSSLKLPSEPFTRAARSTPTAEPDSSIGDPTLSSCASAVWLVTHASCPCRLGCYQLITLTCQGSVVRSHSRLPTRRLSAVSVQQSAKSKENLAPRQGFLFDGSSTPRAIHRLMMTLRWASLRPMLMKVQHAAQTDDVQERSKHDG